MISRVLRSTELRIHAVEPDEHGACASSARPAGRRSRIIANRPTRRLRTSTSTSSAKRSESHHLPPDERVLFVEVRPGDVSEFSRQLQVTGVDVAGHHVLRCVSPAIPNAIAALLLYMRDETGQHPSRRTSGGPRAIRSRTC